MKLLNLVLPLAALLAFAATHAQPVTVAPAATPFTIEPGGHTTVEFSFDFGVAPIEVIAFDMFVTYDVSKIVLEPAEVSFAQTGPAPDFGGGIFGGAYIAGEFISNWVLDASSGGPLVLPTFQGAGLLSFGFTDTGLALGETTDVVLSIVYSTLDANDLVLSAGATVLGIDAVSAVPEPSSSLLLLAGLGLVCMLGRRRLGRP